MKKMVAAAALCAGLGISSVFASIEINASIGFSPLSSFNLSGTWGVASGENSYQFDNLTGDYTMKKGMGLGFLPEVNLYFLSFGDESYDGNAFDLGLNIGANLGYIWDSTFSLSSSEDNQIVNQLNEADIPGLGFTVQLGPAFRLRLGRNAIVIVPAVAYNLYVGSNEEKNVRYMLNDVAINLDIGYRFWFVNKPSFRFGLNLGANLSWPLGTSEELRVNYTVPVFNKTISVINTGTYTGFDVDFYAGLSFDLGR